MNTVTMNKTHIVLVPGIGWIAAQIGDKERFGAGETPGKALYDLAAKQPTATCKWRLVVRDDGAA